MAFDFETSPGFIMERSSHLLRQLVRQTVKELGLDLTPEEVAIIVALVTEDGRRIGDLAQLLIRDATTLTRQIEGLEKKGCVERRPAADDRRVVEVFLTDRGREQFERFDPVLDGLRDQVMSGIEGRDLTIFLQCLRKVRENLLSVS